MPTRSAARLTSSPLWIVVVLLLLAARLPSLVQPAGGDQSLYAYAGDRLFEGDVTYLDAWDQKPPAIHVIYGLLWQVWPHQSVVPAADLVAAVVTAWLLFVLVRRAWGSDVGVAAAALYLLLADPSLQRLSGVWVRGQSETFIALAITASLALTTGVRRHGALVFAGVCFGVACWLKYNAVAYALPIAAAVAWRPGGAAPARPLVDLGLVASGAAAVSVAFLAWLGAAGALTDWWLATITYNLTYSGETYGGLLGVPVYLLTMPLQMARVDLLWYLGGAGCLGLMLAVTRDRWAWIVLLWVAGGIISIALNGARGLPQYFIQMAPILAAAAAGGLAPLVVGRSPRRLAALGLLLALGLWRVGTEDGIGSVKLGGLPGAWNNLVFDVRHATGRTDRTTYLGRFERTGDKYVPRSADELAAYVRDITPEDESILVFGFTASVYLDSGRRSASRFFWSRPVVVGFQQDRPDYGVSGLIADLERDPPSLVALQRRWGAGDPDPIDWFLTQPALRAWLDAGYVLDRELPEYEVWVRRPPA